MDAVDPVERVVWIPASLVGVYRNRRRRDGLRKRLEIPRSTESNEQADNNPDRE